MSVLNDTPSPFASTGLPDESLVLPGYDEWCDKHELEPDDAEMEAWARQFQERDAELAALTARADAEAAKLAGDVAELAALNMAAGKAMAEVA